MTKTNSVLAVMSVVTISISSAMLVCSLFNKDPKPPDRTITAHEVQPDKPIRIMMLEPYSISASPGCRVRIDAHETAQWIFVTADRPCTITITGSTK